MKVLLTGANGFVGSHVLDSLLARNIPTAILLRPHSDRGFIEPRLAQVEVRIGSLNDRDGLERAMGDVTHVVHCAGATKALRVADFHAVNQIGTRHLVAAVDAQAGRIRRLVHLSSLAAAGPATADSPAREADPPRPVSEYGRSKLAGEQEVLGARHTEWVILRPPAVYGPRDGEFLRLFQAVKAHLLPVVRGGRQALSLVYVKDLAEAVVGCLSHPAAAGRTYFVASPQVISAREMAGEIAVQMSVWTVPLPLPTFALWPVCAVQEGWSRLTGRANVLSRQKYPELRAPGWVCDPGRLKAETGVVCATTLREGIAQSLTWYRREGWL